MSREPGEDRDSMPLGLLQRRGAGGGGGSGGRKGNLSVCKPMKGMKILSKGELQYLPMETSWTYCLVDHQLLF